MSLLESDEARDELLRRWPDVLTCPRSGPRGRIAAALFRHAVRNLPIRVVVLDAEPAVWGGGDDRAPVMEITRPRAFFARLGDAGLIGFGEAYLAGDWRAGGPTPDPLADLLTVMAAELPRMVPAVLQRLRRFAVRTQPAGDRNTPRGSRRNIARHYDLSNDLFATFLDPGMTYSAAIFEDDRPTWADLGTAQARKIDRLLDACSVGEGTRLLEIGTGWGELALRAAARGATVRSVTLSEEQLALARRRVADAGLADRVAIELCDYRDVTGTYDAVVSVEMIEAVGEQYWPAYFAKLAELAPHGRIGLQAITMPHDRMLASRTTWTWIHKYVFPGGLIPSVEAVRSHAAAAGLRVADDLAFGLDYGRTLQLWRERFTARQRAVRTLGFDEIFERMWTFYLAYSEAGFRSRYLDVHQFVLHPTRPSGEPA